MGGYGASVVTGAIQAASCAVAGTAEVIKRRDSKL